MRLPNDTTLCEQQGNNCPSRHICARYTSERYGETLVAALNTRREPRSNACDMFKGDLPSTFKD